MIVHFENQVALLGNFEIKVGQFSVDEKGVDINDEGDNYIGLMGNLEKGPPINVIISKEIFNNMKDVFNGKKAKEI